jgi:hypothetical protein
VSPFHLPHGPGDRGWEGESQELVLLHQVTVADGDPVVGPVHGHADEHAACCEADEQPGGHLHLYRAPVLALRRDPGVLDRHEDQPVPHLLLLQQEIVAVHPGEAVDLEGAAPWPTMSSGTRCKSGAGAGWGVSLSSAGSALSGLAGVSRFISTRLSSLDPTLLRMVLLPVASRRRHWHRRYQRGYTRFAQRSASRSGNARAGTQGTPGLQASWCSGCSASAVSVASLAGARRPRAATMFSDTLRGEQAARPERTGDRGHPS